MSGKTTLYGYDGDGVMSYGDEMFAYDGMGNPKMYRDKACEWEKGRQLVGYDGNAFEYDGLGRRISKNTTQYTYDSNGNLIKQSNGENTLEFVYDNKGVMGVTHIINSRTQKYFFRRNAQGDVIAILDNTGKVVVRYVYDVWGNHEAYDENGSEITSATHIGNLNPFRYRGYYYDTETKLYFIKTRYYDPELGRFITIDGIEYLDPESINGLNLYAYCGNNPVMNVDPNGNAWWHWLIGIAVIAVLAVATVVTAGIAGVGIGTAFAAGFAGIAIGAGASGLAVTIAAGAFAGAVIGAGIGLVGGAITGGLMTGTWQGVLDGAANGFMFGSIIGAISGGIRSGISYAKTTPLVRTVNGSEATSLKTSGKFSSNGGMESKWFATNRVDAAKWAKAFGQNNYTGIRVPKSFISSPSVYFNSFLDGIGPAYCIDIEYLNSIIHSMWFF